jgi:ketosteroid isomerase-like protein
MHRPQRIRGVSVLVLLSLMIGFRPGISAQDKVQQELIQIERDWCSALVKKDAAVLGRILADDYAGVGSRGVVSDKAGDLADLKGGNSFTSCIDDSVKVRLYGDTAVVMGHGRRAGTYKGAAFKDREITYTDVFVRRNGQWQCVASQGTAVAPRN